MVRTLHSNPAPATDLSRPSPSARGFTLVELLIVLMLMGMVYALFFRTYLPTDTSTSDKELSSFLAVTTLFPAKNAPEGLLLVGVAERHGYLTEGTKILREVTLPAQATGYRLNPDETLQPIDYPHIFLDNKERKPLFWIRRRPDGYFDPQILRIGDRWLYIHPYLPPRIFGDTAALIAYVHQSDYLPDRAGYAQ